MKISLTWVSAAAIAAGLYGCAQFAGIQTLRPADDIKDARQRYEDVIKLLVRIGKGEVLLEGAALRSDVPDAPTGIHSAGMPIFDNPPSVWAREYR